MLRLAPSDRKCVRALALPLLRGTVNPSLSSREALSGLSVARESEMIRQRQFDDLIKAAWEVIESDFDAIAFVKWRKQALLCLTELLGSDHPYTLSFQDYVQQAEALSVLVGKGLLAAAREQTATEEMALPTGRDFEQGLRCHESEGYALLEDYRI